jgi:hypothetical protein
LGPPTRSIGRREFADVQLKPKIVGVPIYTKGVLRKEGAA